MYASSGQYWAWDAECVRTLGRVLQHRRMQSEPNSQVHKVLKMERTAAGPESLNVQAPIELAQRFVVDQLFIWYCHDRLVDTKPPRCPRKLPSCQHFLSGLSIFEHTPLSSVRRGKTVRVVSRGFVHVVTRVEGVAKFVLKHFDKQQYQLAGRSVDDGGEKPWAMEVSIKSRVKHLKRESCRKLFCPLPGAEVSIQYSLLDVEGAQSKLPHKLFDA